MDNLKDHRMDNHYAHELDCKGDRRMDNLCEHRMESKGANKNDNELCTASFPIISTYVPDAFP